MTHPSRLILAACALFAIWLASPAGAQDPKRPVLLVFAASSLTNVMGDLSKAFEQQAGVPVRLSFAASSVLARQIEAGGKADVFICADEEWMDYLQRRNLIDKSSRRDLAGNRLVLIAPADSKLDIRIAPGFPLLAALRGGRLSTGDPDTVPVGRYARSALISLGVWEQVQERLAAADNVRSAMMFVSRGEAPLGIVYATDALLEPRVRVVGTFPANSHAPIAYPGAVTIGSDNHAASFLEFLSKPESLDTWRRFGFLEPGK
jgi:molybdate transport system substrate-binding protein